MARAAARPGALAYRLLQGDWALGLSISRLDPWVTARVFHDATIREGQLLTKVNIGYRIENAALKSLRVRIPGLDESSAATVRATGAAVADLVPVQGEIPSPLQPPSGCHFHPRCPHALARCREAAPELATIAPGRQAACWRVEQR